MSEDKRQLCVICAWRANCAKRFSMGDDATLHCPDFSEDVSLRKQTGQTKDTNPQDQDQ
jgi:hypothetical protein